MNGMVVILRLSNVRVSKRPDNKRSATTMPLTSEGGGFWLHGVCYGTADGV